MSNTYLNESLIYKVRGHSIRWRKWRCEREHSKVMLNGKHRYAGSEDNKKWDLNYTWETGPGLDDFYYPGNPEVMWK